MQLFPLNAVRAAQVFHLNAVRAVRVFHWNAVRTVQIFQLNALRAVQVFHLNHLDHSYITPYFLFLQLSYPATKITYFGFEFVRELKKFSSDSKISNFILSFRNHLVKWLLVFTLFFLSPLPCHYWHTRKVIL